MRELNYIRCLQKNKEHTWSELISPEEEIEVDTAKTSIAADKLSVYQIGDKFEATAHSTDETGNWEDNKISICVDEVLEQTEKQ